MSIMAITDSAGDAGAITYWAITGETNYNKLKNSWESYNLDPAMFVEYPTPAEALRRATLKQKERRLLVRPLKTDRGWAFVREQLQNDRRLAHNQEFSVVLTEWGTLEFEGIRDERDEKEIRHDYEYFCDTLTTQDISGWLVRLARATHAVALRESGGIYFVPKPQMPAWSTIKNAVNTGSANQIYQIPAMNSADAVNAILDALTNEVHEFNIHIEEKIKDGIGKRAVQTQQTAIATMERKLESYAGLLGDKLASIQESMTAMTVRLRTAEMQAGKDKVRQMLAELA